MSSNNLTRQDLLEHLVEFLVIHGDVSVDRKDGGVLFFKHKRVTVSNLYFIQLR